MQGIKATRLREKVKRPRGRPSKETVNPTEILYVCRYTVDSDEERIQRTREQETPLRLYGKKFYTPTGKTLLEQFERVILLRAHIPKRKK